MPIVTCPHCSNQAEVGEEFMGGEWVECPHCRRAFGVGGQKSIPKAQPVGDDFFVDEPIDPIQVDQQHTRTKKTNKLSNVLYAVFGLLLIVFCSGIIGTFIWLDAEIDEELSKADAHWDAGKRGEAVVEYKKLFSVAGGRRGKLLQRIVEYEVSKGNTEEARTWIEKGLDRKITVEYQSAAAKGLLAQIQHDREEQRARQLAEANKPRVKGSLFGFLVIPEDDGSRNFAFSFKLTNDKSKEAVVYVVVYCKNDKFSPPRRAAWPEGGLLFRKVGTTQGILSPSDVTRIWEKRLGAEVKLEPNDFVFKFAHLPINTTSQLEAWKGQRLDPRSLFDEAYLWVFSQDGELIFERKSNVIWKTKQIKASHP